MRNPFSVEDVPDPVGEDVEELARSLIPNPDPASDENALAWVTIATSDEGLPGAWTSRRRAQGGEWARGVATLREAGGRVYILYRDAGTYLIEAERRGDRLIGRAANLEAPGDTSPWIGLVIDPYRIDGYWRDGRWDLRRCSPAEQPEPIIAALLTEARELSVADLREVLGFARYLRWRVRSEP